jgi:transcriptional regulator with XRE-family HTH domain
VARQISKTRGRPRKILSFAEPNAPGDPQQLQRPRPIDAKVGQRIRRRRFLLGMTQQTLAKSIGVAFQQVQKYESGSNRVSASRLVQIANALAVPVAYFFEDTETSTPASSDIEEALTRSETLDLIRWYYAIPDEDTRKRLLDLIRSMAVAQATSE